MKIFEPYRYDTMDNVGVVAEHFPLWIFRSFSGCFCGLNKPCSSRRWARKLDFMVPKITLWFLWSKKSTGATHGLSFMFSEWVSPMEARKILETRFESFPTALRIFSKGWSSKLLTNLFHRLGENSITQYYSFFTHCAPVFFETQ